MADEERKNAKLKAQPSFYEATKVAAIGATLQGGLNFGIFVYQKRKDDKNIWEFEIEDWKVCGATTAKGAIKGGISGYSLYGLTNVCH